MQSSGFLLVCSINVTDIISVSIALGRWNTNSLNDKKPKRIIIKFIEKKSCKNSCQG